MAAGTVGYDYYIGRRKVHTGITRYPNARLRAHNRATGQRGRIRIRTPRMSNSQARAWKRRQIARGAPTIDLMVSINPPFVRQAAHRAPTKGLAPNNTPNSAAIRVEAYQEARNVAMGEGLPEALVLHSARQVADEVFNRYMQRLVEGEVG